MRAYKGRSTTRGRNMGIMTIEELATLWHFPIEFVVKAPMIQKAPGRKSGPPMHLPIGEEIVSEAIAEPEFMKEENNNKNGEKKSLGEVMVKGENNLDKDASPPANLPIA